MKISQEENLINNDQEQTELKEIVNFDEDEMAKKEKEEIQEEVEQNTMKEKNQEKPSETIEKHKKEEENKLNDDKNQNDNISNESAPIGKKELETILLILNSYWIELLSSISLILSILIYEFLIFLGLASLEPEKEGEINITLETALNFLIKKLGFKWFFFIRMGAHLSVGFFCLTTFTSIMKDTKNIKKFYIVSLIQVVIFYAINVIVLKVLIDTLLKNFLENRLKKEDEMDKYHRIKPYIDLVIDKLINLFSGLFSTFNSFLEKIVFGTMYIFLFYKPKCCEGKKIKYFRLLALIPLIYIIVSLVLRALSNTNVQNGNMTDKEKVPILNLNVYFLPILLGSKITIYVFFISTLSIIKYLSFKYEVFDKENEIKPKIFTKIGSRCFSIMGIIELIIGLFFPSWSKYGIGGNYLLILCAPIMAIYDYKKEYELKFPCCKKGNMTSCFKYVFLIIAWLIVIALGLAIIAELIILYEAYFKDIIKFILENEKNFVKIINIFL